MFLKLLFIPLAVFTGVPDQDNPRIYLIRHAKVDMEIYGWGSARKSGELKEMYNLTDIRDFDREKVLKKIREYAPPDTIYVSPQHRAVMTAEHIFDTTTFFRIDNRLVELDYSVLSTPVLRLPVKAWLFISRITWMAGANQSEKAAYNDRISELKEFSEELIFFAEHHGHAIVVAHGMVNRELIRILKKSGWHFCKNGRDGFGNLSVNCLQKKL